MLKQRTIGIGFSISVHANDVIGDRAIDFRVFLIQHQEKKVETGQQRIGQTNVLGRRS
jgi:hypothetical protein